MQADKDLLSWCCVQFPDPHWKLRNRKKRIVQPQLVEAVAQLIAPGGRVFLQSDVQEVSPAVVAVHVVTSSSSYQSSVVVMMADLYITTPKTTVLHVVSCLYETNVL